MVIIEVIVLMRRNIIAPEQAPIHMIITVTQVEQKNNGYEYNNFYYSPSRSYSANYYTPS